MIPIGRNALVALLPEPPKSTLLITEGLSPEGITRRAVVHAIGGKCQYVVVGDTVLVRTTLGVQLGDLLLIPEQGCIAKVVTDD